MRSVKSRLLIQGALIAFILISFGGYLFAAENEQVIQVTAKRFEYSPKEITLKKGVPVVLEFTSPDRLHGFNCPGLGIRTDIRPGKRAHLQAKSSDKKR